MSTSNLSEETHWEKAAKTRMGKYLTRIETDFVLSSIDVTKTNLIVDVGAEAGRFSLLTATSNVSVIGIDIDSYSLRRLKQKNKEVAVVQADARKAPFRNGSFDAVFMIEVLDYIPQLQEALNESFRILRQDAPFVLSFGNQSSLKAKIRGLRGKNYMHSYSNVLKGLRNSGFQVGRKLGYSWLPFGRMSDNLFVPFMAGAERFLGLRKLPSFSPWIILSATKKSTQ
jgi:ubiquinone/menaquinone biosynthesis C-methylase UbiE